MLLIDCPFCASRVPLDAADGDLDCPRLRRPARARRDEA